MVVPVRVRLAGNNTRQGAPQLAHTLDANESGVKLAGFRGDLNVGDVIEIQHRHERAMFRVVWIRLLEKSLEKHIGAECVEPDKDDLAVKFVRISRFVADAVTYKCSHRSTKVHITISVRGLGASSATFAKTALLASDNTGQPNQTHRGQPKRARFRCHDGIALHVAMFVHLSSEGGSIIERTADSESRTQESYRARRKCTLEEHVSAAQNRKTSTSKIEDVRIGGCYKRSCGESYSANSPR